MKSFLVFVFLISFSGKILAQEFISARKDTTIKNLKKQHRNRDKSILDLNFNLRNIDVETKETEELKPVENNNVQILSYEQIAAMLLDSGNYYMDKGKYKIAIYFFDSLINNYSNSFQYRFGFYFRGKCKMSLGLNKEALLDLNKFNLLDNCQSNFCTDSHYNIGILKLSEGKHDEAFLEFNYVLADSTFKNKKLCYFYRAFCYSEKNDFISAVQDLTKFINESDKQSELYTDAFYNRGYFKAQLKDNRGAIKDYDEAAFILEEKIYSNKKSNPSLIQKLIDTYIVRGLAKSEVKKYDEAIKDYEMVIALNPTYSTAYRLKGLAHIAMGKLDEGCLQLSKAGELGSIDAYNDIKTNCNK